MCMMDKLGKKIEVYKKQERHWNQRGKTLESDNEKAKKIDQEIEESWTKAAANPVQPTSD